MKPAVTQVSLRICTPAYGGNYTSQYLASLLRLTKTLNQTGIPYTFSDVSYADVVDARNILINKFYQQGTETHMLFLDNDMGYPAELIMDMIRFDKPLTGVVYQKRAFDMDALLSAKEGTVIEKQEASAPYIVGKLDKNTLSNGFMRSDRCGTGIMLIKRELITQMIAKLPAIRDSQHYRNTPFGKGFDYFLCPFNKVMTDSSILSEDFSFCHRWVEQCGGELWVNINHQISHIGPHQFIGRYATKLKKGSNRKIKAYTTTHVATPATENKSTARQTISGNLKRTPARRTIISGKLD